MENELNKRLKEIEGENKVFGIFIIIILLAYYANNRESNYFITGDQTSKKEYYYTMIIVFLITVIISAYYVYISYQEVMALSRRPYSKRLEYARLDLIASTLALIAALIYLYIAITDTEIEAEISL